MKTITTSVSAATFALILGITASHAAPLTVPNYSFEAPASAGDHTSNSSPNHLVQDWTFTNPAGYDGTVNYSSGSGTAITSGTTGSQGAQAFPIFGYYVDTLTSGNSTNNDGSTAGSSGILSVIKANTAYSLTASVGFTAAMPIPDVDANGNGFAGTLTLELVGTTGYVFGSKQILESSLPIGSLTPETLSFTSESAMDQSDLGEGLRIKFIIQNGSADTHEPLIFDDVQLSGAVVETPEPSTYALMLGGLAVLGFMARRKSALFRA